MPLRLILFLVLGIIVARAFWRLVDGIVAGVSGRPLDGSRNVAQHRVQMVRDPVCGTFILPDRALVLSVAGNRVFFCSDACRDEYRARPSTGSGSPSGTSRGGPVAGRTA
jgi:YHS domain-containing protein